MTVLLARLLIEAVPGSAQEILTAENFFDRTATVYAGIEDYIADITITMDRNTMAGVLFFKNPNLLRIDFSNPNEQTIVSDGTRLIVYLPRERVTMVQTLRQRPAAAAAGMASRQGLQLLRRNYSVAYLGGPNPVPLEPGSDELVTNLRLTWRNNDEGFRQIDLSIGANGLIRRIVGITVAYRTIQFDFRNIRTNQNIPAARFRYDPPPSANVLENFLFEAEN